MSSSLWDDDESSAPEPKVSPKRTYAIDTLEGKKIADYTAKDIVVYFGQRFHVRFHCPYRYTYGKEISLIQQLLNSYSSDEICKAIRWLLRPMNYAALKWKDDFPSIGFLSYKANQIFPKALRGENAGSTETKTIKKIAKNRKGGIVSI